MELDKAIQSRHSVRKFLDKKPDWKDIIEAIDSTRYAPMAGNSHTVKFILVDDSNKIQMLSEASQQPFVNKAQYVVVVCSVTSRTTNAYEKQGEIYLRQQAGAAIQNFLLKIQELGLATCWTGHLVEAQVKRTLKIPANVQVEAIFPIGYEFGKSKKKRIADIDSILFFNEYKKNKMNPTRVLEV